MKDRRSFLKLTSLAGMGIMGGGLNSGLAAQARDEQKVLRNHGQAMLSMQQRNFELNERMRADYETGLNILKPSKKQLDHGLDLHRNSLVFDTYGFMPRAAVDGSLIASAISDNASPLELQDMNEDMSMTRYVSNPGEKEELANAWKASGVTCVFQNAGEEGSAIERLVKRLARFTFTTDMLDETVVKAATPDDIVKAWKEKKHALYFSGNGVPLPQEWVTVEEELRYIKVFFQLGIRMMHLTYNRRNVIGDGCAETANAGLSDFGRAVVKEMNRVGVIVDVAHSGWQTSLEAAQISEKPMVASHSSVASIHKHIRSKPDDVIKAIADTDGYIGICCIPRFLGGTGNIADMMKHIDYVAKKFGSDHVGIGTDVAYTSSHALTENAKIPSHSRGRTRWEALWPADNFKETSEMHRSMAWTNWPLFTVGMVQMGYSDNDIQKMIGGNALRVAKAALAGIIS